MSTIRRRTLLAGTAWSVPVVAMVSSTPAFALSPVACPTTPAGGGINPASTGGWTWVKSANTNGAPAGMLNSTSTTFNMWVDSTSAIGTNTATVTATSTNIAVKAGCTYQVQIDVQTQGGYYGLGANPNTGCTTRNTNMVVDMGIGATRTQLLSMSTQAVGGGVLVQFPIQTPTGNGGCTSPYGFGANGIMNATQTFVGTYTATATGNATIRLLFTIWGNANTGNNDDTHATITLGPACLC